MISSRILLAGLFCLCPFSLAQKIEPDPKHTLIIISTSDIHGNLDKFPKLATLVKKYRSKFPHVLLMDSGDYFMGNPFVDDWEKPGLPITILMNKLGYDAATIGNHDMDYGQTALRDHIKGMPGTKFVVTNLSPSPPLENCFLPYASIPIKGTPISVGVIGLVDMQTTDILKMDGITWKLPNETDYKGVMDRFRLHHNTINVILSHMGYDHDLKMMKYSPNIDVILGGHTHVMLPKGHLRTGSLLSHTGHKLSYAGVTKIIFSTDKKPAVLSKSTEAVSLDHLPDDPEVKEIVRQFTSNPFFNQQVAIAKEENDQGGHRTTDPDQIHGSHGKGRRHAGSLLRRLFLPDHGRHQPKHHQHIEGRSDIHRRHGRLPVQQLQLSPAGRRLRRREIRTPGVNILPHAAQGTGESPAYPASHHSEDDILPVNTENMPEEMGHSSAFRQAAASNTHAAPESFSERHFRSRETPASASFPRPRFRLRSFLRQPCRNTGSG